MRLSDAFASEEEVTFSSLSDIFEEEPVSLDVFVQDKKFLANPPLSPVQFEAVQHIERIYLPSLYPLMEAEFGGYWADPVRMTNLITLQWGKGSGKDHVCRVSSLRVAYLLLCLKSPQRYYAMPEQDSIHLLNIASNSAQAYRAFFKPMTHAVKRGWFADKAEPTQNAIQYAKHIEAVSGHSEAESQEGLNLMLGVADEIDAFKAKDEMVGQGKRMREATTSAESILEMLKTSASTRFPESYKRVAISFPRYEGSTIQRLTKEGRDDIAEMGAASIFYVSGPKATWEVNPRVTGKEQFATDYRKDPEAAAAKYECKPSRATDAYFRNPQIFSNAIVSMAQPISVSYRLAEFTSEITGLTTVGWEPEFTFDPGFLPIEGARYVVHGDLAVTGDRAGVAMSHVTRWEERTETAVAEDGEHVQETQVVPHVHNDFTISLSADVGAAPPREIQIRWLRRLVFDLIKRGFYVARVTCDGFQSVDTLQTLAHHGIAVDRVSTDRDPSIWKAIKDIASEARLTLPHSALLLKELSALSRVKDKVDHPIGGCFVGETRIPLLDGTFPQISELANQQVWVYSADSYGKIKPGLARGRRTKMTTDLVDVILDSGYVARCTPEHLWMLRDGSYKEARSLRPGIDRLMPVGFTWPVNGGYVRVTDKDGVRSLAHHMVAEHFAGRAREAHEVVHHKNEVKTDNRPENLEILAQVDHVTHHADALWAGKEQKMREGYAAWAQDDARKAEVYASRSCSRARTDVSIDAILDAIRDGARNRAEAARILECDWTVVQSRLKAEGVTFPGLVATIDNNHKVRAVVPVVLNEPVPVYDLEVDEFHNFALSGGVFVHNSKDEADAFSCSIVGAIAEGGAEGSEPLGVGDAVFEFGHGVGLIGMDAENSLFTDEYAGFAAIGEW